MRQFRCFDELRSTTPSFDGEVVYLTSWNDDGSFVGYGKFAGYLSAGTDNGITISSNGGAFHWKRICYDFLTPFDMGLAPNAEDATSTIQSLIDFVEANGVLIAGNGCGRIILPDGYIYRITDELKLSVPMDFFSFGAIHYDMSSGLAISVGQDAGWSNGYDIRIRNLYSNGGENPASVDASGPSAVQIRNMVFSYFKLLSCYGFGNTAINMNGTGNAGYKQVVQHNRFHLGQVVNNGVGVNMLSLDAASSSVQGNYIFAQNVYQNQQDWNVDDDTHFATDSNYIHVNAMDNAGGRGMYMGGRYNHVYIGFAGNPGRTLVFGPESSSNSVEFGNNFETDITVTKGGTNNRWKTAMPSINELPKSGIAVVNGDINYNTYGVPVMIYGSISTTVKCNVQVDVGPDTNHFLTVQNITTNGESGNIPFSIRVPSGGCWRLFVVDGGASVNLNAVSIHDAS